MGLAKRRECKNEKNKTYITIIGTDNAAQRAVYTCKQSSGTYTTHLFKLDGTRY